MVAPLLPAVAVVAALLLGGLGVSCCGAIQLEDVPHFVARCRVDGEGRAGQPPPPRAPSSYYFGGVFAPVTPTVQSESLGAWSTPLAFNATHAAAVAQSYPNSELAPDADLPTHAAKPFYLGYSGLSLRLGVGLLGVVPPPGLVLTLECQLNFTSTTVHPHDAAALPATIHAQLSNNRMGSVANAVNPYRQGRWPGNSTFLSFPGLMLSRDGKTGAPLAMTLAAWNKLHFWDLVDSVAQAHGVAAVPKLFPIGDGADNDDDLNCAAATTTAMNKLGLSVVTNAFNGQDSLAESSQRGAAGFLTLGAPSLFRKDPSGANDYLICNTPGSACTLHDYCSINATDADLINDTDIDRFMQRQVAGFMASASTGAKPHFVLTAEQDEPGWSWPIAHPPVTTSSRVRARWHSFLASQGLRPSDLGASSWAAVKPLGRTGAGAGKPTDMSPLALRRLYYWSMRFSVFDAISYMTNSTARLQLAMNDPKAQIYTNFNNMAGRSFVAGNGPKDADPDLAGFSFDWFEWARRTGSTLVWTEDWCSDAEAQRWSFFASRMRSAIALRSTDLPQLEFGGYIVPRSSGDQDGGLMRRILSLVGGGSKGFRYYTFGPEYSSPGNGYSDVPWLSRLFSEMMQSHNMIAKAEDIMWEARRPSASVAMLIDKSSQYWDDWGILRPKVLCLAGCTKSMVSRQTDYFVESYGLFMALSTDSNVDIDWIDEEALLEPAVMQKYKVLVMTSPNVPTEGLTGAIQWANKTGGVLVTTSNAALWDRYNEPSSVLGVASGIKSSPRARASITGSPPPGGTCTATMHSGSVTVPAIFSSFNFTASGSCNNIATSSGSSTRVLGRFDDGNIAVAQSPIGTAGGSHLHFGWQPGLSYLFSNGGRDQGLRKMLKTLVVDQLGITPLVTCNTSLVEAPLLLHPNQKSAVITLLNWTASAPTIHGGAAAGESGGVWHKNTGTANQSMIVRSCGDGHAGNPSWKVVDGIFSFGLGSAGWVADDRHGTEEWIVFDLGSSPPITNGIGIWSGGDGIHDPKTLVLQKDCQLDNSPCDRVGEWEAEGPPQSKGRQVFDFAPVKSQYFRLEIIDRQSGTKNPSWLSEVEFRVVGSGKAGKGPAPPVALQVTGLPFTPATVRSVTHGKLSVQVENGTVASFALPLLHGDIILLS